MAVPRQWAVGGRSAVTVMGAHARAMQRVAVSAGTELEAAAPAAPQLNRVQVAAAAMCRRGRWRQWQLEDGRHRWLRGPAPRM
jgi:hypothetical protein